MGIPLNVDWQQILLHLFNFIILFGGLWLLLYKPVKNFMAKREAYYKDMDKAAAEKLAAAENEQQKYSGLIGKAQDEAAELKKKAMADADAAAKAHLDEAEPGEAAHTRRRKESRARREEQGASGSKRADRGNGIRCCRQAARTCRKRIRQL